MMSKLISILVVSLVLFGCIKNSQIKQAKIMADHLLDNISSGRTDEALFPKKYFHGSTVNILMNDLHNKCDFAHRKGNFINDFYQKDIDGDRVSFIYEYYLKCDSIRFILTYNLGKVLELYEFKLEPIEKDNYMIINSEKRLKFQLPQSHSIVR